MHVPLYHTYFSDQPKQQKRKVTGSNHILCGRSFTIVQLDHWSETELQPLMLIMLKRGQIGLEIQLCFVSSNK